jgi:hypothetical protein
MIFLPAGGINPLSGGARGGLKRLYLENRHNFGSQYYPGYVILEEKNDFPQKPHSKIHRDEIMLYLFVSFVQIREIRINKFSPANNTVD